MKQFEVPLTNLPDIIATYIVYFYIVNIKGIKDEWIFEA